MVCLCYLTSSRFGKARSRRGNERLHVLFCAAVANFVTDCTGPLDPKQVVGSRNAVGRLYGQQKI